MTARTRRRRWVGCAGADDGQTTILTLGLVVVALLLVTVVVSATGVHLDRKRLLATADATALEAADALSTGSYFDPSTSGGTTSGGQILLTDRAVEGAARAYLAENPEISDRFVRLELVDTAAVDGRSAQVRLRALVRPALVSWVTAPWSDGIVLEAESTARAW
ncbi:pilus assembly protein TadG-related protein [Cellulomonas sp. 179-A 4D5 NHS]